MSALRCHRHALLVALACTSALGCGESSGAKPAGETGSGPTGGQVAVGTGGSAAASTAAGAAGTWGEIVSTGGRGDLGTGGVAIRPTGGTAGAPDDGSGARGGGGTVMGGEAGSAGADGRDVAGAGGMGTGGSDGGGSAGTSPQPAEETLIASSFAQITLRSSGGMPGMDEGGECNTNYIDTLSLAVESRTLTWNYCGWGTPRTVVAGSRVITELELQAVRNVVSQVAVGSEEGCGVDKPMITLDAEVDGVTTTYFDDFYACAHATEPRIYVTNIDSVAQYLGTLTRPAELPETMGRLRIYSTAPLPPDSPPESTCGALGPVEYEIDPEAGNLSWVVCAQTGSVHDTIGGFGRALTDTELTELDAAYRALRPGATGACAELGAGEAAYLAIDLLDLGSGVTIVDQAASCVPGTMGDYYYGVAELSRVVDGLVE